MEHPGKREHRKDDSFYRERARRRRELVATFGCDDCGVPAGTECRPEYGCTDANRTVGEPPERTQTAPDWSRYGDA